AMLPLGILAVFSGFFEPFFHHFITHTLPDFDSKLDSQIVWNLIFITSFVALAGIVFAVIKYYKGGFSPCWEQTFIYRLLFNQYYIPYLYEKIFIQSFIKISRFFWSQIDKKIIDFIVDGIAYMLNGAGFRLRVIQSGNLSNMLRIMFFGLILLLLLIFIS
ncbi:MAG: NADH-quinone oxidoreductase subunit L, partial [Helicobacter apodemus]|nr:NADH-quinone oxidoreductase subunit L [Helicobacter apodemus]